MTVGSLFSGIGGMDLGLERAGMEIKWQVEIDPYCQKVLAKHWPNVPRWDDVRTFTPTAVDLVAGGFPCQPHSSAARGRRLRTRDPRWLWPSMLRVCAVAQPTWVLVENVPGLSGATLEQVVSELEAHSYEVQPLDIPACAFGYDHRRSRYWILGYSDRNRESRLPVNAEASRLPSAWRSNAGEVGSHDGLSSRMDRLKALGNAVVVDIPEWIGRRILDAEGANHD